MVSPIYIVVIALGAGFLIPFLAQFTRGEEKGSVVAAGLFYAAVTALVLIPAGWLLPLAAGGADAEVFTAGARPPISINLRMGLVEAAVLALINLVGLFSAFAASKALHRRGAAGYVLVLMMLLGANGLILTRDLFNAFVFLEILSIGTYAIIALDDHPRQYAAGFKYLIAGGISSVLFLLGTVYLYRLTGTLNIDGMIEAARAGALEGTGTTGFLAMGATFTAPFLLFSGILIELKPFPANGWALDAYEASHPGIAAMISAVNATAVVLLVIKVLPLFPESILVTLLWVGFITFFAANLMGMRQRNARRMLGYSSVAQIGLIGSVVAIIELNGLSFTYFFFVAGGLLVNHLLAKAGLFWIAQAARADGADRGARAGIGPIAGIAAVAMGLALTGLPPFPAFWAKWQIVSTLLASGEIALLVLLLAGSLFEAIYLLRWVGTLVRRPDHRTMARNEAVRVNPGVAVGLVTTTLLLGAMGVFTGWTLGLNDRLVWAPLFFATGMLLLEWLPSRVKGLIAVGAIGLYAWLAYPLVSGLALVLGAVFAAGSIGAVIASLWRRASPTGTYTSFVLAGTALVGLTLAAEPIAFFLLWEFMTIGSYLLIARSSRVRDPRATASSGGPDIARTLIAGEGPGATPAALRYIGFSVAAALLIMVGLMVASHGYLDTTVGVPELFGADGYVVLPVVGDPLTVGGTDGGAGAGAAGLGAWAQGIAPGARVAAFVLLGLGFLIKMGAMGLHIWLPDAYAEADDEASAFLSSALSKAGILGVVVLMAMVGAPMIGRGGAAGGGVGLNVILGWIGAFTALFGALMAVFQEDVKKLLAFSSLSQVGYMVLGIALATHLGWLAGMYTAVNHFIFKGLLFLGIAGVIMRTGTRYMYQMGGLIKRMPLTFISVLMAIIALSGVPPLSGFGGKWLIYGALLESEWYIQAGVAFFASTVAFLYLFRMIYSVFLGQLKDDLREVKEAPPSVLLPQIVLMGVLMLVSMYPNVLIEPIIAGIEPFLSATVRWQEYTVITALGYWNGNAVMWVTMGVFILPLVWLVVMMRRPQKVRQFNMVYSAERPERPETTHFAHNFFAPYRKALGFLVAPALTRGWHYAISGVGAVAGALRQLYTGNGQTYALHILLLTVVLYFIAGGM